MKIVILYSLPTRRALKTTYLATDEDTQESAEKVHDALLSKNQEAFLQPITEDTIDRIGVVSADCIMNLIEWSGLDLPLNFKAVEALVATGIPFTGADLPNLQITSDKVRMKQALDIAHLPNSRWQQFATGQERIREDFSYPVIVKLALEHCSIGLSHDAVVFDPKGLRLLVGERIKTFGQPVLAEEFITGGEFQVTVLDRSGGLAVLPPAEILFIDKGVAGFLTYESRWDSSHIDYNQSSIDIAHLDSHLSKKIETIARDTFTRLKFCDYARLDIRVRDENVFILEANSNPGLDDDDEYGMTVSYKAVGMTFADFVWEIVVSCLRRFKNS